MLIGLLWSRINRPPLLLVYLTIPLYLTALHALTIPATRYGFPIIVLLLPFAALGLLEVASRLSRARLVDVVHSSR